MANPYAPPGMHDAGYLPPGTPVGGGPMPWELGEVLTQGWETLKRQPLLAVALFIMYLLPNTASFASNFVTRLLQDNLILLGAVQVCVSLFAMVVSSFLQVGMLRMHLTALRGEEATLGLLFSGADRFLPLLGYTLLSVLLIGLGMVLLIVPGVIVFLGLWLAPYYLVDQRQGVFESMKSSWEATRGTRLDLFLFSIVGTCLALLGVCACFVGVFATGSVVMLALGVIYLRRSGQASAGPGPVPGAPGFAAQPVGYGAPGGYPPPGPGAPPGGYPPTGQGAPPAGGYSQG